MNDRIVVNMSRARVKHPDGTIFPARFVYHQGRAAVWTEDRATRTASRVLYIDGAVLTKPTTARNPYTIADIDGTVLWEIKQERGGCGCSSPLKNIRVSTLLDPTTDSV